MSARGDLLHLSPEALTQVANAGVVKRAMREMQTGYKPHCALDEQATLTARFSDGITVTWVAGKSIDHAACTCGAANVCRHRIIAALTFREASTTQQPQAAASPGSVTDETLARIIPTTLLALARQQLSSGMTVDVRRKAAGEPCDTARLPASTVRFWGGDAIETARCDCIHAACCDHVALAVWAFREADEIQPDAAVMQVRLGQKSSRVVLDRQPYLALIDALLRHGVSQGVTNLVQPLSSAFDAARSVDAAWLVHLLADFERWSIAYSRRSALYEAAEGVGLIAELSLRTSAASNSVLGVGQAAETELDRLRLMCLGARTFRDDETRLMRMVLADVDTGTALALSKEWSVADKQREDEAAIRSAQRMAPGVRLDQLAQGQLLAQQAKRLADGTVKLAKARSSQNSVLPQAADWGMLGAPLRFANVGQLLAHQRAHPTSALQPRHAAGRYVVFTPSRVEKVFYDPNEQALVALIRDSEDGGILLRRVHESHLRHALDTIADACTGGKGLLRHVAGVLSWDQGVPVIEPWALACDSIVVPDLVDVATGALAKVALGRAPSQSGDRIAQALGQLRETMAMLIHHGIARLPRTWAHDVAGVAQSLAALSLNVLSQRLKEVAADVMAQQGGPSGVPSAARVMELLALLQLHEDAHVTLQFEIGSTGG